MSEQQGVTSEGRVVLGARDRDRIAASLRGDGGFYDLIKTVERIVAARVAAAVAEERERLAQAIEAAIPRGLGNQPLSERSRGLEHAACIARNKGQRGGERLGEAALWAGARALAEHHGDDTDSLTLGAYVDALQVALTAMGLARTHADAVAR